MPQNYQYRINHILVSIPKRARLKFTSLISTLNWARHNFKDELFTATEFAEKYTEHFSGITAASSTDLGDLVPSAIYTRLGRLYNSGFLERRKIRGNYSFYAEMYPEWQERQPWTSVRREEKRIEDPIDKGGEMLLALASESAKPKTELEEYLSQFKEGQELSVEETIEAIRIEKKMRDKAG